MSLPREKHVVISCLLLAAVTLAFYNPIVRNQFVDFDDLSYIVKNNHVLGGVTWTTVKWAFTTFRDGNWHPLTWLSHALDCQIFHLNPIGHHYNSLLLHAACAVLLFLLFRRATGLTWPSLVVAALFALHPVNVESVAWAAERKNVLSMLFFLLALYAYDSYARTGRRYLYWLVTASFALGLLAKPQIVTLPFVLLLWDYWPLQRMDAAPLRSRRSGFDRHRDCAARRVLRADALGSFSVGATAERLRLLREIYREGVLADSAGSAISASRKFAARLAGVGIGGAAALGVGAGDSLARPPLFGLRLVLVSGNFDPDDWDCHRW